MLNLYFNCTAHCSEVSLVQQIPVQTFQFTKDETPKPQEPIHGCCQFIASHVTLQLAVEGAQTFDQLKIFFNNLWRDEIFINMWINKFIKQQCVERPHSQTVV